MAKLTGRLRNCPPSSKTKSSTVCFTFTGGGRNLFKYWLSSTCSEYHLVSGKSGRSCSPAPSYLSSWLYNSECNRNRSL
ncbi:unnamed protein product [Acanthoscelides obtectus]|uniref:Uncharacterized protein n=1 Tax=Acanthoscelides obtectus TaxID=200917 RepID=A0A9P0L4D8_ACAOB|nr:unnamed protein product [Acanthoscelides obtectus]CAK1619829.1 hypothetical protein AOBTE_LOCUS14 [Acanthoscelides obtectus]